MRSVRLEREPDGRWTVQALYCLTCHRHVIEGGHETTCPHCGAGGKGFSSDDKFSAVMSAMLDPATSRGLDLLVLDTLATVNRAAGVPNPESEVPA